MREATAQSAFYPSMESFLPVDGGHGGWFVVLEAVLKTVAMDPVLVKSQDEIGADVVGEFPSVRCVVSPAGAPASDPVFSHFHYPEGGFFMGNKIGTLSSRFARQSLYQFQIASVLHPEFDVCPLEFIHQRVI